VLGVEPDKRVAAVARMHGVRLDQQAFEEWNLDGRWFDLW